MKVKIKTWKEMEKEFGFNKEEAGEYRPAFLALDKNLPAEREIELSPTEGGGGGTWNGWYIPAAMITEPIEEEVWFSGPATIVWHSDGTKTVARVSGDDTFDPVYGYLVCRFMKESGMTRKDAREWFDYLRQVYEDG